ncbi:MAG: ADP-heptose synthase [Rhodospirillales bacterium]|nr:ADP-heptose synthase [Rhodospirillales bacterium]
MPTSLSKRYKHKIKTAEELREILGAPPRESKVIMCHGVFDVVHPGHIRHFLYAKSKADILVTSLTADKHITKGKYRPHVPEDLRALNLAAFEVVDYVIIDHDDKPLKNIEVLKPDYFAKGYEYVTDGTPIKTQEEAEVLATYGGEMIFTPGDIVYSSSSLINLAPPDIQTEKLLSLMEGRGITFDILRESLNNFAGKKVHVIGDTIVDSYTQTNMIGSQTKTPTLSVHYQERNDYNGGAAIVAKHLRAAGADVVFTTVLGDDDFKDFVIDDLDEAGVDCRAFVDPTRPTTNKNAIVAGGYRLLKIDTLDNRTISDEILSKITDNIRSVSGDALVCSDFRHGIFNRRTIPALLGAIPENVFKVADSQVASRWGNITEFKGFDLIAPNEREARFSLADQDSGIRPLAASLYDQCECKNLILKLGDRGTLTCDSPDHEDSNSFFVVDNFVNNVVDAVGAGDALLAYATLSMVATKNPVIATILGSMAAAAECEKDGNHPITPADVRQKIDSVERRASFDIPPNDGNAQ